MTQARRIFGHVCAVAAVCLMTAAVSAETASITNQSWDHTSKPTLGSNLSSTIPYPFHSVQTGGVNKVMFIDDGIAALTQRINMIRRARKSIEVEYFIYTADTTGRIFSRELMKAAQRGVKVRVLIDKSKPVFEFNEFYAKEMAAHGVQVRYYNASGLWQVSSLQFRTHRKLLVIDDREVITGGRNIEDDYFDLSHSFNFNDSDMYAVGPIAKPVRESFDLFFEDTITERPSLPKAPLFDFRGTYADGTKQAKTLYTRDADEAAAWARMSTSGLQYLKAKKMYTCPQLTFTSDAPGANFVERLKPGFVDRYRFLRKTLYDKISGIDERLIVSSPYVIAGVNNNDMLDMVLKHKAKVDVYTNSLGSTDATYVAANMYLNLESWRERGVDVYLHTGEWIPKNPATPAYVREGRTGTHSKVQIYRSHDSSEVMIGTYNVDHRSNYYNAEMALFCKGNEEFTREVEASIRTNMEYGLRVTDANHAVDRNGQIHSVYGASSSDVRKMKMLTLPFRMARELF